MSQSIIIPTEAHLEFIKQCGQQGQNSKAYFGRDTQLDAPVFIKVINKADLRTAYFEEAQQLYAAEHPNVLKIRCATQNDNYVFLVMNICHGGSVQEICEQGFLTCRRALKIAQDFLSGLHYVHTRHLIHFDIKPSNILLQGNGTAVLADFGLAERVNPQGFAAPEGIYSTHMPPEWDLQSGGNLTTLSDVYQAGITLYRMCNGEKFYRSQVPAGDKIFDEIRAGRFPNRKMYLPHVPKALRRIINKAIQVNPDDRYQAIIDFQNALAKLSSNLDWECENEREGSWKWSRKTQTQCLCFETEMDPKTFSGGGYQINLATKKQRAIMKAKCSGLPNNQWEKVCTSMLENLSI